MKKIAPNDTEYFKETARRIFQATVKKKKKKLTEVKYIEYLEKFGENLFEGILNLVIENVEIKHVAGVEHILNHAMKFIGKKINPKNQQLYSLIDLRIEERKKKGLSENLPEVIENIALEKKLTYNERKKLHRNYIKYRKNTLRKVTNPTTIRKSSTK